jgi:hypothetical protein
MGRGWQTRKVDFNVAELVLAHAAARFSSDQRERSVMYFWADHRDL